MRRIPVSTLAPESRQYNNDYPDDDTYHRQGHGYEDSYSHGSTGGYAHGISGVNQKLDQRQAQGAQESRPRAQGVRGDNYD